MSRSGLRRTLPAEQARSGSTGRCQSRFAAATRSTACLDWRLLAERSELREVGQEVLERGHDADDEAGDHPAEPGSGVPRRP